MQGVVLQTYGAGNAPDNRPDLLNVFREASNIGVIIINISQCPRGNVSASYATGKVSVPSKKTRHVFVKHGCPRRQQSQIMAKISKSYILTQPHPHGHVMSVKCEEPIDELTVQVWLLYHHPNLKYWTLFVSGTELQTDGWTDGQTDGQTDDPNTRCPRRTFQAGGIKLRGKDCQEH